MKNLSAFLLIGAFAFALPFEAACETVGAPETSKPLTRLSTDLHPGKLFSALNKRKKQNKRHKAAKRRARWAVNG